MWDRTYCVDYNAHVYRVAQNTVGVKLGAAYAFGKDKFNHHVPLHVNVLDGKIMANS